VEIRADGTIACAANRRFSCRWIGMTRQQRVPASLSRPCQGKTARVLERIANAGGLRIRRRDNLGEHRPAARHPRPPAASHWQPTLRGPHFARSPPRFEDGCALCDSGVARAHERENDGARQTWARRASRAAYHPHDRLRPSQPITPASGRSNLDRLRGGLIGCRSLKHLSDKLDRFEHVPLRTDPNPQTSEESLADERRVIVIDRCCHRGASIPAVASGVGSPW
jgi:hypothetical protein